MKKMHLFFILFMTLILQSCIGEDIIDDRVPEEIRFLNTVESIEVSEVYEFSISFFNNVGEQEEVSLNWFSSNPLIATVDANGRVIGVSEGETTITVETIIDGVTVENSTVINVTDNLSTPIIIDPEPSVKSGTIITTSSYLLEGDFTFSEIENTNYISLSIQDNYRATTSLPGLYIYLSNNPNSIANALEIGAVETFSGEHSYTINDVGINDYAYVLYWCKPFGVKVGEGEINN